MSKTTTEEREMTATRTRRPLIDPTPDRPLNFHGWRIDRAGSMFAATKPHHHGRQNSNHEVRIGSVTKVGGKWIARSDGGLEFEGQRQQDAASDLMAWYEAREQAHGGLR